ncbi:VanZ family protein [Microbulbifer aggregans]|uniref:VanZ family protein n=1 Tax=Microbulbifer aggregans TaxID=1769779 RepID=UPI0011AB302B|nr:VanZ family protein [Microbulbifer aggregans]
MWLWRLLLLAAFALSFGFGLRGRPLPLLFPHFDLLLHFAAFYTLGVLAILALRVRSWLKIVRILLLLFFFAALIEWLQALWLPQRTPSLIDLVAGVLGALAACLTVVLWCRLSR